MPEQLSAAASLDLVLLPSNTKRSCRRCTAPKKVGSCNLALHHLAFAFPPPCREVLVKPTDRSRRPEANELLRSPRLHQSNLTIALCSFHLRSQHPDVCARSGAFRAIFTDQQEQPAASYRR